MNEYPDAAETRSRSLFRFSLRSLLAGVTVFSVFLGLWLHNGGQCQLQQTNRELDIAIIGPGYLPLRDENSGDDFYTRNGRLSISSDGLLYYGEAPSSYACDPPMMIPAYATKVTINSNGYISYEAEGVPVSAGQFQLAQFPNPTHLKELDGGLFETTPASGLPVFVTPGDAEFDIGMLAQGWLERPRHIPFDIGFAQLFWVLLSVAAALLCLFWIMCRQSRRLQELSTQITASLKTGQ